MLCIESIRCTALHESMQSRQEAARGPEVETGQSGGEAAGSCRTATKRDVDVKDASRTGQRHGKLSIPTASSTQCYLTSPFRRGDFRHCVCTCEQLSMGVEN